MKFLWRFISILSILCAVHAGNVLAEDINLDEGEKIFSANCVGCHAGGNNVLIPERTLQKEALETFGMNSVEAIKTQVTNGKNAMPAFGGRLTDEDIVNVANYVLNQSQNGW